MEKKSKIEKEVKKTLQSFESAKRIEPNPFFFTRVNARINEMEQHSGIKLEIKWIGNFLKPAFLLMLILFNVFTAALFLKNNSSTQDERSQLISTFAEEYSLEQSQLDILSLK